MCILRMPSSGWFSPQVLTNVSVVVTLLHLCRQGCNRLKNRVLVCMVALTVMAISGACGGRNNKQHTHDSPGGQAGTPRCDTRGVAGQIQSDRHGREERQCYGRASADSRLEIQRRD